MKFNLSISKVTTFSKRQLIGTEFCLGTSGQLSHFASPQTSETMRY